MSVIVNKPTLFGLDLSRLGRDWRTAVGLMAKWPGVHWLVPRYVVEMRKPTGQVVHMLERDGLATEVTRQGPARYKAHLVPTEAVLWHTWHAPRLEEASWDSALTLELQRINPFEWEDLVWASTEALADEGHRKVLLALTSRKLLEKHLGASFEAQEIWTQLPNGAAYLPFLGFAETRRHKASFNGLLLNLTLVLALLAAGAVAAVTPTLQLRERALAAATDFEKVRQQSTQAIALRETLIKEQAKVQQLQSLVGSRMVPENTLLLVTRYLPDDTYILVLDVKGQTVNLTGVTPNAAALMQHLGRQPGVKKVTAPNAARRDRDKETFNIEFELEAIAMPAPMASEPAPATNPAKPDAAGKAAVAPKTPTKP